MFSRDNVNSTKLRGGGDNKSISSRSFHLDRIRNRKRSSKQWFVPSMIVMALVVVAVVVPMILIHGNGDMEKHEKEESMTVAVPLPPGKRKVGNYNTHPHHKDGPPREESTGGTCLQSLSQLTEEERRPSHHGDSDRHTVPPPVDNEPISLVCCETTAGSLSVAVHPSWAPVGARHFLDLVESEEYFASRVPLMRCIPNFLCQFGIAGDPEIGRKYTPTHRIVDDPNWLPEGPTHRTNAQGVKRFARGYLAYAGSGKDSRGNQFIMALGDNGPLGGGSPWEVPWGEVVGKDSFNTLGNIYTGYGEKGPTQGRLAREGASPGVAHDFPKLDYVTSCRVVV